VSCSDQLTATPTDICSRQSWWQYSQNSSTPPLWVTARRIEALDRLCAEPYLSVSAHQGTITGFSAVLLRRAEFNKLREEQLRALYHLLAAHREERFNELIKLNAALETALKEKL